MRFLVVEDVLSMQKLVIQCVKAALPQAEVRGVASVPDARRELLNHRPDLVLLDLILPGELGRDFMPELKRAEIRFLVLKEDIRDPGLPLLIQMVQSAGGDGVLEKPNTSEFLRIQSEWKQVFQSLKK